MSEDTRRRPPAGAPVRRARPAARGASADYRGVIFTPTATFTTTATLVEDGAFTVGPSGAPADLDAMLAMQAKLLARGVAKRREDGLPAWPARLLRWRGPGR